MQRNEFRGNVITVDGLPNGHSTVSVYIRDKYQNVLLGTCTTLPSALAGYAVGCQMIDTATGNVYVNTGSITSCTFTSAETGTTATLAATGNSLATAADITADTTVVTGADGTKAVSLPVPAVNKIVMVINSNASNALPVYPDAAGTQINALGAGNAFTITAGQMAIFVCRSATLWYVSAATDTITGLTASAAELNLLDGSVAGTAVASKALALGADKNVDVLAVADLKLGAGAGTSVTATAAELNVNAGVTGGTVIAAKTVVADANKAVDTLRATTSRTIGGTGVPGGAAVQTELTKAITAFSDTVAKDVFTVTIPNAAHAAVIEVDCLGVLGAGGAIGAGEATRNSKYQIVVVRTAGVNAVATVSSAIGGAAANVAGGQAITSVVVTASAIAGAVGDPNTFTIKVAITRGGAGADNHTGAFTARILNQNATGITIA
ncbi:MAG: hypothetical protein C4586_08320 [Anaerolineaceae bacterium]|nr:MAG: hypothetical protein C4586_08320 [Anaerolineaceae bacterium]